MERPKFVSNSIYHIFNRGVEKRKIFLDDDDYFRFIHNLFEFNDTEPAPNLYYKSYELRTHKIDSERKRKPRKLLVRILAFCLLPNHFHLLVEQVKDKGIVDFIRKVSLGYAMYFNKRHERVGSLFQGRFKSVPINQESYFIHIPYYIHLNPLDLIMPEWREGEVKDYKKAMEFLENYRWSSFLDYIGKKNFPSVTQREFLSEFFDGPEQYRKDTVKWLKEMDLEQISHLTLE